ncbi:hypothetical protein E8E13_003336 [Curvularia kusanoi]|uniref:Uncharacterized protein n=1 Tax=Curvularia kusanoi TaxID=90978 RepID=A0A9P4T6U9_CURKU|nr:hypothetical protein E8E13_003336 [Curvularia kusanoi]
MDGTNSSSVDPVESDSAEEGEDGSHYTEPDYLLRSGNIPPGTRFFFDDVLYNEADKDDFEVYVSLIAAGSPEGLDERLHMFDQTPAQVLMKEKLVNSQSRRQQFCKDGKEAEQFTARNDSTLFSRMAMTLDSAGQVNTGDDSRHTPPFNDLKASGFDIDLNFEDDDAVEKFDFDSFLHMGEPPGGFASYDFTNGVEAGDGM